MTGRADALAPAASASCFATHHPSVPTIDAQGNLAWSTTSESLKTLLETVSAVESVIVQAHTDTGRSKGWAYVGQPICTMVD